MKNVFFWLTIIIFSELIFNNCQQKFDMEKINSIIESAKEKYAPDKREAIFNISFKMESGSLKLFGEVNSKAAADELFSELEKLNLTVKKEVTILPEKNLGENIFGIINLSVANIRSEPKHSAELATQALLGTVVNVLKKEGEWYLVQTPDKYISWIEDDEIFLTNSEEINSWKNTEKVIITEQYTFAYESADLSSQKISDLVIGDIIKELGNSNNFTKIGFPDGRTGFVETKNLQNFKKWEKAVLADGNKIVETAKTFMGLPYLWGGTSSKNVDCSGFTKTAYFMNGVILPRDASLQVNVGELINTENNFDNLLPGDLLFFGKKKTDDQKEKITHVAIYIGNYQYIHAAGRVRINSLDKNANDFNDYRFNSFIRAKRIIGSYDKGENLIKNNPFYN